jgi:hypothetical protein
LLFTKKITGSNQAGFEDEARIGGQNTHVGHTMIENFDPQQAWDLLKNNSDAVLVDVRTKVEHSFVGHPPGAIHIPWKESPDWQVNPQFVAEVKKIIPNSNAPIFALPQWTFAGCG